MKAFPIVIDRETQIANDTNFAIQEEGMDLRDYFAAKAMQIVGLNWQLCDYGNGDKRMDETPAMLAYAIADAMMKAREK